MTTKGEALTDLAAEEAPLDLDLLFRTHYAHVARLIARIIRDPARAEELAVEVFLRLRTGKRVEADHLQPWLMRTAIRTGLNELRGRTRRARYEALFGRLRRVPTPEDLRASNEQAEKVRAVLGRIKRKNAELLLLRSQGFNYTEIAANLGLNPASIGTLLSRAQHSFRKEYVKLYGKRES